MRTKKLVVTVTFEVEVDPSITAERFKHYVDWNEMDSGKYLARRLSSGDSELKSFDVKEGG